MLKTSMFLVSLFSGAMLPIQAQAANLLDQRCDNAASYSIRVVNNNGRCNAYWSCDGAEYKALCDGRECSCYQEGGALFKKVAYEDCDSAKLKFCFNR